jgi:hypothetical protein
MRRGVSGPYIMTDFLISGAESSGSARRVLVLLHAL